MASNHPQPPYDGPPPFTDSLTSVQYPPTNQMESEMGQNEYDRTQRAASVLSGMSIEDMEAAETLNSLYAKVHSPQHSQPTPLPTHIQTTSSFEADQQEPILRLLTSTHPLAASLINGSLSAYKTTQSYIPGAEWTERNVGLPLAGTISRVTGVEGGLRWALQGRANQNSGSSSQIRTTDVEKGLDDVGPDGHRRGSEYPYGESLPAYNSGDRSPPYTEQQVVLQSRERQPPPGWRQQLVISTSGLGVAMSEESLRSLRYCLTWLRWANTRLDGAVQSLRELLRKFEEGGEEQQERMSVAAMTQSSDESRKAALMERIAALKADVLNTLKQVVGVVSNYAGGALPANARDLVHRHLTSLPQRFSIAYGAEGENERDGNARRVMVLAAEGLDMMTQVTGVVNDTLVSAESWCDKLGRRRRDTRRSVLPNGEIKIDDREKSSTIGREVDNDVKMAM